MKVVVHIFLIQIVLFLFPSCMTKIAPLEPPESAYSYGDGNKRYDFVPMESDKILVPVQHIYGDSSKVMFTLGDRSGSAGPGVIPTVRIEGQELGKPRKENGYQLFTLDKVKCLQSLTPPGDSTPPNIIRIKVKDKWDWREIINFGFWRIGFGRADSEEYNISY